MKKILLITLFILVSLFSFSQKGQQTIGISFSPNSTLDIESNITNFALGGGLFFNYQITNRLGFETGINYLPVNYSKSGFFCLMVVGAYCPKIRYHNFHIAEIPLLFNFNTNINQNAKYKFYVTGGYSLGRIINIKVEDKFHDESNSVYDMELTEQERNLNVFNLGFEIRHKIANDYQLSFGGNYRYTYRYSLMSENIYNFSLLFKIGKLL